MKISDTIESVLKSKDENRVLSVTHDQFVYEAIQKLEGYLTGRYPG